MATTAEFLSAMASYQFYTPRVFERERPKCFDEEDDSPGHRDSITEAEVVKLCVQFWPGEENKAMWFFTWNTSATTQRILTPDAYGNLKTRTYEKRDIIYSREEVPQPAGVVHSGADVIWVVEWNLGALFRSKRRELEDIARNKWISTERVSKMWAKAVVEESIKAHLLVKGWSDFCLHFGESQNEPGQCTHLDKDNDTDCMVSRPSQLPAVRARVRDSQDKSESAASLSTVGTGPRNGAGWPPFTMS